jgi:superfamily II DNA or RNA helicase
MINRQELIEQIPDGKKGGYLGQTFVKALTDYHIQYTTDEIDLNELVSNEFQKLILQDTIIKDLKLFAEENLAKVCGVNVENLKNSSIKDIRKSVIDYYNFEYDQDKVYVNDISSNSECQAKLHDFQERIRRKVINLIFSRQKRFLIHMPTGSGKTRTAAEVIIDFIRLSASKALLNDKMKVLWIAQSSELCFQAYETVKWLIDLKGTQEISFGHFYENNELDTEILGGPAIIFCSIQKLLLHYKDDLWGKIKANNYLVVVDEAHRSVAKQWLKALDYFVSDSSVFLLGLTATPGLGSGDDDSNYLLSTYYQSNKISITDSKYQEIEKPIQYLVERKFLAKIIRIDIDSYLSINEKVTGSINDEFKFTKKTFKYLSVSHSRNSSIINIILENFRLAKKILVFTCGLDHNRILQALLLHHGITAGTIDQSSKDRNTLIDRFKNGNLMILLNYGVLTTGFDAPKTDVCIIARPISSVVMYSQMVGRILRGPENKGNEENLLYTIKDNLNHGEYDEMFNSFNEFYK